MTESFETLAQRSDAESFEPGEPIYREREPGSVVFLLVEGEVVVESEGHPDEIVRAGELFGEAALFGEGHRHGSARALTAARVVPIGPALYESLAAADSGFAWSVRQARSRRLKRLAVGLAFAVLFVSHATFGQVWGQGNQLLRVDGSPLHGMDFGATVAAGDFNGDGIADLAVGAPDDDEGEMSYAGRVAVHLGSPSGLQPSASLTRKGFQEYQYLGEVLAAGDFNGDGRDELVIGMPDTNLVGGSLNKAGMVEIQRLDELGVWHWSSSWSQDSSDVLGGAEEDDGFGSALAVGDFDDDGYDDLAIGTHEEDIAGFNDVGAVNVLYGGVNGLSPTGNQIWYRNGGGIVGEVRHGIYLGAALAAGDFDGDGVEDLAMGLPGDRVGADEFWDGSVVVLFGAAGDGLVATGQQQIHRELMGIDIGGSSASFGSSLGAGDLNQTSICLQNANCADDLVVGAPHATVSVNPGYPGAAYVLFGSPGGGGLATGSSVEIAQGVFDTEQGTPPEDNDRFGEVLAVGSLSGGTRADLAVATPDETLEGLVYSGCVHVARGVTPAFDEYDNPDAQYFWAQPGLAAAPADSGMWFGSALAIGDFDGDGWGDLAIGIRGKHVEDDQTGAVQILYGALFADGFERQNTSGWSPN